MNWENQAEANERLDALLRAYREACPAPEPSANFMPEIWRRIDERQRSLSFLGRWARTLATAAAVLSLALAAYLYIPRSSQSGLSTESYVEALASAHAVDSPDAVEADEM